MNSPRVIEQFLCILLLVGHGWQSVDGAPIGLKDDRFLTPDDFENAKYIQHDEVPQDEDDPTLKAGMFEGDINLLGYPLESYVDTVIYPEGSNLSTVKRDVVHSAVRGLWQIWPNATVPYVFDPGAGTAERKSVFASAIREFEKHTCIKWRPKVATDPSWVRILAGGSCWAVIGKSGGRTQGIGLGYGCLHTGIAMHEMMHTVGFFHEQSRADRDSYVTIHWENIGGNAKDNFKKATLQQIDHLGTSYDYGSLMHYRKFAFSSNGRPTVVKKKHSGPRLGQREGFSKIDIERLNRLYKCNESKGKPSCFNKGSHCDHWASVGDCRKAMKHFMAVHCRKACGWCTGG